MSDTFYLTLLENLPNLIWRSGPDGKCDYVNRTWLEFTGMSLGQAIGDGWMSTVHPDDLAMCRRITEQAFRECKAFQVEYRIKKYSGEFRWIVDNGRPCFDSEENFLGFIGSSFDITERHLAEQDLKRLATAIEQSAESVIICDPDWNIQYVNPAFIRISGYSLEESLGKKPRDLMDSGHGDEFYKDLEDTVRRGDAWTGRFRNRTRDGGYVFEESTISPVRDNKGRIINYVAVKRDITAQLRLEEQLLHAQKMDAIGHLAGGIAHDFNNQIQGMLSYVEMVMEKMRNGESDIRSMGEVQRIIETSSTLIRQLLFFSRKQTPLPRSLDLNKVISGFVNLIKRVIGEHIELIFQPGPDLRMVSADPAHIEQTIMNLCLNSRDAMPSGGKITIETQNTYVDWTMVQPYNWANPGEYVLMTVTDTGTGIPADQIHHIFEPFFTTKEVGKGTGLGLATVYGIIRQHKGFIEVSSRKHEGSTFRIYIPAFVAGAPKSNTPSAETPSPARGGKETVLLVEDEKDVREVTTLILEQAGYHVLTAPDGEQGLRVFQEHVGEIRIAVLDVVMPRLGGEVLCEKIKSVNPGLPVIFTSGYSMNLLKDLPLNQKDFRLIHKPYHAHTLLKTLRDLLDASPRH